MTRAAAMQIPIPQIQGRGFASPYVDKSVATSGVITAIVESAKSPGIFIQDLAGDNDDATSDGLFVSTLKLPDAARAAFEIGRVVSVSGTIEESNEMTTLHATPAGIKPIKGKRLIVPDKLPAPVKLDLPAPTAARNVYLESREAMLGTVDNALALSPTTKFGNFAVVNEKTHGPKKDIGDDAPNHRLLIGTRIGPGTQLSTGDRIGGIFGPIANQYGDYELLQSRPYGELQRGPQSPKMYGDIDGDNAITPNDLKAIKAQHGKPADGPLDPADLNGDGKVTVADSNAAVKRMKLDTGGPSFTIANLNVENFFDNVDAPPPIDDDVPSLNSYNAKLSRIAGALRDQLGAPDVVAMQEVENTDVLKALTERPELKALGYKYALLPTQGHRSINPAILYRGDDVQVTNVRQTQRIVPRKEAEKIGLGKGGDAPLFSREPLIVDLDVQRDGATSKVTVIANHLISKLSSHGSSTEPIRLAQTRFLNDLVQDMRSKNPDREIVVIGDLNDTPDSKSLKALVGPAKNPVLINTTADMVPANEAYSYNYKGKSELIDHILVTPGLATSIAAAGVRHLNSDQPDSSRWGSGSHGSSDHDSPYVRLKLTPAPAADAAAGAAAIVAADKK